MKRAVLSVVIGLVSTLSLPVFAGWTVGGGISNLSSNADGADLSINAALITVGYQYRAANSAFSFTPELRLGTGLNDERIAIEDAALIKVELERLAIASLVAAYHVTDTISVFAQPSYGNMKLKANFAGESVSDDDSEFGFGVGIGIKPTAKTLIKVSFEQFDDTDVITGSWHYHF